jgi:hypothetical protein
VRWLDAEGQIASPMIGVSPPKPGDSWPTIDRAPDGFWVAWQDDRDKDGSNLFLRHLDTELHPTGNEIRATDYVAPEKGKAPQVRVPSVAVGGNTLFVAYSLDRDKAHLIERMRLPLTMPELRAVGLEDKPPQTQLPGGGHDKPKDRELGDVALVNDDRVDGDLPAMACGQAGCFVVWQGFGRADTGAQAALIDPAKGILIWRKKFAPKGSHPSLAVSQDGQQVSVSYYEGGKVRIAALSRDGVGTTTTFGKVGGDPPRPWIAGGKMRGEWYVAWQDVEAGHNEAYVARLLCRN